MPLILWTVSRSWKTVGRWDPYFCSIESRGAGQCGPRAGGRGDGLMSCVMLGE